MHQQSKSDSTAAHAMHTVLRTHGLDQAVEVFRDRWGIAHLRARSDLDALFCARLRACPGPPVADGRVPHAHGRLLVAVGWPVGHRR